MSTTEAIKTIRLKRFLTQEEFAKELGVSFVTVNRWETGKTAPTLKNWKTINSYCKAYSIDFDVSQLNVSSME